MAKEKTEFIGRWAMYTVGVIFAAAMTYANVASNTERIVKLESKMERYSEAVIRMEVTITNMSSDIISIMDYLHQYDFERSTNGKETSKTKEKKESNLAEAKG